MAKAKKTASTKHPAKNKQRSSRAAGQHRVGKIAVQSGANKSTKIASMTVLLCRVKGVSLDELCKHTGWQPHSVRAVISSVMKRKLGLDVVSERVNGTRIYRVIV